MSDRIRMLGMNSGLDTESIVTQLVKAQSTKKESLEKEKTKLGWKQEVWKELNTKVKTLYNKSIDNLRWTSSYKKKKTTVGDSKIASVVSSDNAVNGTQTMAVKQLAKSGYLTGGKLSENGSVTGSTTLSSLSGGKVAEDAELDFTVKSGDTTKNIKLNGSSTIDDLVSELKSAGISATFDKSNQRIFLSATNSGVANDFTLTANNSNSLSALAGAGLLSKEDIQSNSTYADLAAKYGDSAKISEYATTKANEKASELLSGLQTSIDTIDQLNSDGSTEAAKAKAEELKETYKQLKGYYGNAYIEANPEVKASLEAVENKLTEHGITFDSSDYSDTTIMTKAESDAQSAVNAAYTALNSELSKSAERVMGQDAIIMLNGVDYSSATNSVSVNGLTITAQTESEYTEVTDALGNVVKKYTETSVNTQDDVDGIYDMIKSFFKEYNDVIKEMDTRYNADRAKGYEPLTDDEKDAMSDDEVEKWETKIKDSLLRGDSDLSAAISALKNNMNSSFVINGQKISLSTFGIETLSYFSAADNEHGIYHIDGDSDDEATSTNADKLKSLISTDPELVMNFFTQLANGLYQSLDKLMSRTDNRSKYSIYDDKALKSEYEAYDDKIEEQEDYISDLEDRYYDQFTAMEKAMAEVEQKQSALSGLLG